MNKLLANWIINYIAPRLKREGLTFEECPISIYHILTIMARINDGTIHKSSAYIIFDELWMLK